jgi:TolB-like protein/Tfp pilus assembly protein PilF
MTPGSAAEVGEAATAMMPVQHSTPGVVMGTVGYMSPEQAQAKSVDQRSDIFSFGCLLYEAATGRKPFAGDSIVDTLHKIIYDAAPAITDFNPSASPELQRVIRKCLAKEPEKRYQTIRDTANDLEELLEEMKGVSDIERSVAPSTGASSSHTTGITNADPPTLSTASVTHPPASSAEYIFSGVKEHKFAAAVVVLVLIVGVAVGLGLYLSAGKTAVAIESIAVMPFVNESGNADVEYLSDGMTETLINSLSKIPNLSVKARSSVFRYKGKEIDPKKIAAELSVQAMLTGRVVQRGDQLTLNLELIDAQTENILWGNRYERKSSELVALQTEIARDVSSKLRTKLSGADVEKVGKSYTSNPESYQLYLKGRFSWNKRTPETLKQAVGFYGQAIEKDPNYALAFSGLAETYVLFAFYDVSPAKESMPKAKAAIDRALAIDDSLAEAHAARGKYLAFFEFDRSGSEREFRRAIELNPNYATAYQWLGLDFLVLTRRFDEGIRELRRAGEIDPLSPVIGSDTANAFSYAGRFDEAIDQARRTLELEPGFSFAHTSLGYALHGKGHFAEAISAYEKALSLSDDTYTRAVLIRALMQAGRRSEAERQMEALRTLASKSYVPNFCFAIAHTALGNKEAAIAMLEKDVEERSSFVVTIGIELGLNELRDHPRFKAMLQRMNLPE